MQLHIRGLDTYVLEADSFETINDIKVKFIFRIYYLRVIVLKLIKCYTLDGWFRGYTLRIAISCEMKVASV